MIFSSLLTFLFSLFGIYETDQAALEAGQSVNTPGAQVGTVGGKPLYLYGVLTTTKQANPIPPLP